MPSDRPETYCSKVSPPITIAISAKARANRRPRGPSGSRSRAISAPVIASRPIAVLAFMEASDGSTRVSAGTSKIQPDNPIAASRPHSAVPIHAALAARRRSDGDAAPIKASPERTVAGGLPSPPLAREYRGGAALGHSPADGRRAAIGCRPPSGVTVQGQLAARHGSSA
jgi:hypothetical protein